jgi:hypothetical protein
MKRDMSRHDIKILNDKRQQHRALVKHLRVLYSDAIIRASSENRFQTLTMDGADSAKCRVPQDWVSSIRLEQGEDDAMDQKMQTCLSHGKSLRFYPLAPFVSHGGNKAVSCTLDTLWATPVEVREMRWQLDGTRFRFGGLQRTDMFCECRWL